MNGSLKNGDIDVTGLRDALRKFGLIIASQEQVEKELTAAYECGTEAYRMRYNYPSGYETRKADYVKLAARRLSEKLP